MLAKVLLFSAHFQVDYTPPPPSLNPAPARSGDSVLPGIVAVSLTSPNKTGLLPLAARRHFYATLPSSSGLHLGSNFSLKQDSFSATLKNIFFSLVSSHAL